jgi:hypothetical protein
LRKFEKGKRGSGKLFPLFPFSNLFYLFLILSNTNMQWKRRKENGGFGGERKNSYANGGLLITLLAFLSHRIIYEHTDANCSLHPGVFQGIESTGSSNSIISIE